MLKLALKPLKLARFLKPYRPTLAAVAALLFAQAAAELHLPFLMTGIVNYGIVEGRTEYIPRIGAQMLLVALLAGIAAIANAYLSPRIAAAAARDIRRAVFVKVGSFSLHEIDTFSTASLITRNSNDVTQVQNFMVMAARALCYAPILGAGGIIMAMRQSVDMGWIIALAVALLLILVGTLAAALTPKFKIMQELTDRLNKVSRETLNGLATIRAFAAEKHEQERFNKVNSDIAGVGMFVSRVLATAMPALMLLMNGIALLVIWTGSRHVAAANLQVGDMMAFLQYAMQIMMAFMLLSMSLVALPRAAVCGGRILAVLDTEARIKDPPHPVSFDPQLRGVVEFQNVSFRYEGAEKNALSHLSFTAKPGQTTAIIGPTGAGKTTIASLLMRFYDASDGSIFVEGADIRQARQNDLRRKIGYVPQKGQLLKGTIADNIRYGKEDATDGEIRAAAEIAQALDFIFEKSDGFEAEVAQGGSNVSGGQRQRLSIARALAGSPSILLFDDSFSALDFQTDARLRAALQNRVRGEGRGVAIIVIAQRVGTIMDADQILVLEQGEIAGRGTHGELLENCPIYREIAASQLEGV